MIYLDSSALLKLVFIEDESEAYRSWHLSRSSSTCISSALIAVEVNRSCRRADLGALPFARQLLAEVDVVPIDESVLGLAGELADPQLRSLDAIHLASALCVRATIDSFVTYDRRLAEAASSAGFAVLTPGAGPA